MRSGFVLRLAAAAAGATLILGVAIGAAADNRTASATPMAQTVMCSGYKIADLIAEAGGDSSALTETFHSQLGVAWKYDSTKRVDMVLTPRLVSVRPTSKVTWLLPGDRETLGNFTLACVRISPPTSDKPIYLGQGFQGISSIDIARNALDGDWRSVGPNTLERTGPQRVIIVPDHNVVELPDRPPGEKIFLPDDHVSVDTFLLHYHSGILGPPGSPAP